MASLRDIRNRIKSVKNTQKITKAMKMVSAAKLRRAQEAVEATRPYADRLLHTVSALAKRAEHLGEDTHPLLRPGLFGGNIELIVMTSNRGLCGGFNSNTVRRAQRFIIDEKDKRAGISVSAVGKKGFELLKTKMTVRTNYSAIFDDPSFANAEAIAKECCAYYVDPDNELDGVFLLYNEFKGGLTLKQMLPVVPLAVDEDLVEFQYEPSRGELLDELLPAHFAMALYRALLETIAAEHLARMMAMDSATTNAGDMVDRLTLKYNRARQAAITTELSEIIGGAEAL
jgi:F-type H+-transporting ATPase subunit gamma